LTPASSSFLTQEALYFRESVESRGEVIMKLSIFVLALVACAIIPAGALRAQDSLTTKGHFTISGGISVPVGDFASISNGAAKMGFTAGAEYELRFGSIVGWVTQFNFIDNAIDEEGARAELGLQGSSSVSLSTSPWIMYTPVTGIKLTGTLTPDVSVFFAGAVGATFGTSPELTITGPGGSIKQSSASATAFAYAISGGLVIGDKFRLSVKYISSKPKYDVNAVVSGVTGNMSVSGSMEEGSSVVLIEAGVEF
jgi:hypothetical protein